MNTCYTSVSPNKVLLLSRVATLGVFLFVIIILSLLSIFSAFYRRRLLTNLIFLDSQQCLLYTFFLPDLVSPIRSAVSGANATAIGKNQPF